MSDAEIPSVKSVGCSVRDVPFVEMSEIYFFFLNYVRILLQEENKRIEKGGIIQIVS